MKRQVMKNTASYAGMSLAAGVVARFLAKHMTTEKAREWLAKPRDFVGIKIPTEFGAVLTGSAVSLTVGEVLSRIPGVGNDYIDYAQDFCVMVAEEYDDELEKMGLKGSTTTSPNGGERRATMFSTYGTLAAEPAKIVCTDCSHSNHFTFLPKKDKKGNPVLDGDGNPVRTRETSSEFRQFPTFSAVFRAVRAGAQAADHGTGCLCSTTLQSDLEAYEREERERAAGGEKGRAKAAAKSFAEIEQEVFEGASKATPKDTDTLELVEDLSVLLGFLNADAKRGLTHCNTAKEYLTLARKAKGTRALVAANDVVAIDAKKAEIATYLDHLRDAHEIGKFEDLLGDVGFAGRAILKSATEGLGKLHTESQARAEKIRTITALDDFAFSRGKARIRDIAAMLGKAEEAVTRQEIIAATTPGPNGRAPLHNWLGI